MGLQNFFETHPVFRYEEFADYMDSQGVHRRQSWQQQLNYHKKVGNIISIRKFLYAVVSRVTNTNYIDPYLVVAKATRDAVIAYHTALELYGMAYTTFSELYYLSSGRALPFTFQNQRYRAINQPKALIESKQINFGVDDIKKDGVVVRVTCFERTIVDILDRPDLAGGWEEIWRSLEYTTHIDISKVIEYALLLNNSTTIAKVGFFLEQRPSYYALEESEIKRLLPHIPKQPHYMNRTREREGKYIEKWQLIVPNEIINKSWEEPDVDNV